MQVRVSEFNTRKTVKNRKVQVTLHMRGRIVAGRQMIMKRLQSFILTVLAVMCMAVTAQAEPTLDEVVAANKAMPVQTDQLEGWPAGPAVAAQAACLMDADTGAVLYAKNMDEAHYPASTTKIMTCLLAAERCRMDEMVTFSREAVFGIERGSSNVGIDAGESMTMEESLYCILLESANEVASGVAEHVGGSIDGFAELMNERAAQLGCTNTHFVNANGLHNDLHYTTAHDLCVIARAFFNNEQLRKIASTTSYKITPTAAQPDEFICGNHHKMLPGKEYAYENIVGGKTGYTTVAHHTLITCAQKNGMTLVCAVMRDEKPYQYQDTKDLFEYGFNSFAQVDITENETGYRIETADFFKTDIDIFKTSRDIFALSEGDRVTLPLGAGFEDLTSQLIYDDSDNNNILADLVYSYNGILVGTGHILLQNSTAAAFEFGSEPQKPRITLTDEHLADGRSIVYVNVRTVIIIIVSVLLLSVIIFVMQALLRNYTFASRRRRNIQKKNKRYKSEFDDFDF